MGYADIDIMTKLHEIRNFDGGNNDWLSDYTEEQLIDTIVRLKRLSETVRSDCQRYGLRYFETSTTFETTLMDVHAFLQAAHP
jgi:hypothetical protein